VKGTAEAVPFCLSRQSQRFVIPIAASSREESASCLRRAGLELKTEAAVSTHLKAPSGSRGFRFSGAGGKSVKWITAQDLERWAGTFASRSDVSQLVSDLVRASVTDLGLIRFPTGDSSQMRGWDGHLISSGAPPHVPEGESGWEFGTNEDVVHKANKDYAGRLNEETETDYQQQKITRRVGGVVFHGRRR
jgi:hypothetical protein